MLGVGWLVRQPEVPGGMYERMHSSEMDKTDVNDVTWQTRWCFKKGNCIFLALLGDLIQVD